MQPDIPKPVSWTWKDVLLVMGTVFAILVLVLGFLTFLTMHKHRRTIEERAERWRSRHDLSESQMLQVLEIERQFHFNGNPFSTRSKPTRDQLEAHRRKIKQILHAEDPIPVEKPPTSCAIP